MITKSELKRRIIERLGITIQNDEFCEAISKLGIEEEYYRVENKLSGERPLTAKLIDESAEDKLYEYLVEKLIKENRLIPRSDVEEKFGLNKDKLKSILKRLGIEGINYIWNGRRNNFLNIKEVAKVRKYVSEKYNPRIVEKQIEIKEQEKPSEDMNLDYFIDRIESVIKYNNLLKRENESQKKLLELADKEIVRLKNIIEENNETIDELNNEIYIYKNKEQDKNEGFLNKLKEIFRGCYD